ncbi:hypothetical protein F5Y15DRAFT_417218 [Xylariaceae sp. FL0016]|nr:hypothetical protein F5Y15DRAFT_417218 [Xylariaceae sp. FL0016]
MNAKLIIFTFPQNSDTVSTLSEVDSIDDFPPPLVQSDIEERIDATFALANDATYYKAYGRLDGFRKHMQQVHNITLAKRNPVALRPYVNKKRGAPAKDSFKKANRRSTREEFLADIPEPYSTKNNEANTAQEPISLQRPVVLKPVTSAANQMTSRAILDKIHGDFMDAQKTSKAKSFSTGATGPFDSFDREELTQQLQAKMKQCNDLQEQCTVLRLERYEYIEALKMSEEMRTLLKDRLAAVEGR